MPRRALIRWGWVLVVVASLASLAPVLAQPASVPAEYRKYFVHYREDNRSFLGKALTAIGLKDVEVGRSFALVAGVDTYPSLPTKDRYLEPARVDLEKVVGYLRDYEFFDEIILLRNEAVTDANFKYFLQGYLPPRLKASEKSRLLFAYSGHGIQDGPRGYLLQASARSFEDLVNTISLEALSALYRPATEKAFQSLALINACHSGSFGAQTFGPESERRLLPRDPGSHVITAGATNQPTWHLGTVGPGSVFFEKVLAGLGGWADSYPLQRSGERGDGVVTATELYEYLSQEIQLETNSAQQPRLVFFSRDQLGSFFFLNRQRQVRANTVPAWEKWRSPFGFGAGGQDLVKLAAQAFGRGEYERSTTLYRQGCESGNLRACAELGWAYRGSVGMATPDPNRAFALYERACDGGDLRGCAYLGAYYWPDVDGPIDDPKKAVGLFQRSCDGGDPHGCIYLASALLDGAGGLTESAEEAVRLAKRICDGGEALGCAFLGFRYLEGEGGLAADPPKALALLEMACDEGEPLACSAFGELLLDGEGGIGQDVPRAMALSQKACDGGVLDGCVNLGRAYEYGKGGQGRDFEKAVELYQRACLGRLSEGCSRVVNFSVWYKYGSKGLEKDERKAVALVQVACDHGSQIACVYLGAEYEEGTSGLARDARKAVALFQQACTSGEMFGCARLGESYEKGLGGLPKAPAKAVSLYQKACDNGISHGCTLLGMSFENGVGGLPKDPARALSLYEAACKRNASLACQHAARLGRRP